MDNKVEFILRGKTDDGREISTNGVSIKLLKSVVEQIDTLVMSIGERSRKDNVIISVTEGSLNLGAYLLQPEYNILNSEFDSLFDNYDLNNVGSQRRKVFNNFVELMSSNPELSLEIKTSDKKFHITNKTQFTAAKDVLYINEELYLYGTITTMGGKQISNIHLVDKNNVTHIIDVDKTILEVDKENRLYKETGVRVEVQYDLINKCYDKKYKLIEFIDYNPTYDEQELSDIIKKGTETWADVDDHLKWKREIRGDYE